MRKITLLLILLVVALAFRHSARVMAFLYGGGIMFFVVLLVAGVLFVTERARRY